MKTTPTLIRFTRAGLALVLLCGAALPALATTRTVTSTKDDGGTSTLRMLINASLDNDTINITATGTIVLTNTSGGTTSGELLVGRNLTIIGPGATNLTISGNNSHRVFEFVAGKTNTISGLTISNGRDAGGNGSNETYTCNGSTAIAVYATPGTNGMGGGILNNGTLAISNCVLSGNAAAGGASGSGADATVLYSCGGGGGGIILSGAPAGAGNGSGGAVFNGGSLVLSGCTFNGNSASGGTGGASGKWIQPPQYTGAAGGFGAGGILYNTGTVTIVNCTLAGNSVSGGSGGKGGDDGAGLSGNRGGFGGSASGGSIYSAGTVTLVNCTLAVNNATGGQGGKGGNSPSSAGSGGNGGNATGGSFYSAGTVTLVNCTLAVNNATGGQGGTGGDGGSPSAGSGGNGGNATGGAIENVNTVAGSCTLNSCTVSGNNAIAGGGGSGGNFPAHGANGANGQALGGGTHAVSLSRVDFQKTIVALNSAPTDGPDVYGGFGSGNFNLIGKTNGGSGFWKSEDLTGSTASSLNPLLGPLQDNGGPTPTMALLDLSPAIDKGKNNNGGDPATDQRGFKRPVNFSDTYYPNASGGNGADIGAFELQPPTLTATRTGTKVVVTWPSPSTGFLLLQSPSLNPANWTTNNTTPADDLTTKRITNNSPTGNLFYRLKQ